jgi:light-regulated signal transduction histidine kinase (bacteriophytochrome)
VEVSKLPETEADPTQMQLLQNLINNGLKFNRVCVTFQGFIQTKGNQCVLFVKDNGIDLMQYLDRIFKPFQRLHSRQNLKEVAWGWQFAGGL